MARKTPRPKEEALAIVRSLRGRYISGEAELAAKAAMSRLEAGGRKAGAAGTTPRQPPPPAEEPFTEEERARAKAILSRLKSSYPRTS